MKELRRIPLSGPDITDLEIALVNRVLRTPYLSMGPMIEEFERAAASFIGKKYAAAVSNGTSGLHLCVEAAGVGPGDEVITTPFSFVASANCILYEGGTPVFVDIDPETLNIDVDRIEEKVTSRTKAILPVHIFGQPCQMDRLMAIAQRRRLRVIEDACEAMGAEFEGRRVGSFGDGAVFAFYPNKQMTTAEGGIIVTDDVEWFKLFRSLRNQGRDENGTWLHHTRLGYNYRLDEISSALGVAQLQRIDELLNKREAVAGWYTDRLEQIEGVETLRIDSKVSRMSWFVYVVMLSPELDRNRVMGELEECGVPSRPYFTPIHLQPFYIDRFGFKPGDFPITEAVARRTLALPFYGGLKEEEVEFVCRSLRAVIGRQCG
ncbi:MAG: DegT/DnrJ/EryC1/StrS family aminotransferase [Chloroflexi bacterium]|nr:DegT/DnrJ/EryC1/StrS family aminotransferase [Chloroflexota bacterium]